MIRFNNIDEVKYWINEGITIYWSNENYICEKWNDGKYYTRCIQNDYSIGIQNYNSISEFFTYDLLPLISK